MTREEIEAMPFFNRQPLWVGDGWLLILAAIGIAPDELAPSARAVQSADGPEYEIAEELVRFAECAALRACEIKARCEVCK